MGASGSVAKPSQPASAQQPSAHVAPSVSIPSPVKASSADPVATTKLCDTCDYKGPISVFFGSETGTADIYSRRIVKEGTAKGLKMKRIDLADFTPDMIQTCGIGIFLLSNRGEGEPPSTAVAFCEWLESPNTPANCLKDMYFTVFGLGNSTYVTFNKVGKSVNAHLERLGGNRIFPYGQGDDSQDLEGDFNIWKEKVMEDFAAKYVSASDEKKSVTVPSTPSFPFAPVFKEGLESITPNLMGITTLTDQNKLLAKYGSSLDSLGQCKHYFTAAPVTVIANKELRNGGLVKEEELLSVGSTRHIELDITNSCISKYETAENLGVLPCNRYQSVLAVAKSQNYPLAAVFDLVAPNANAKAFKPPFPYPCSVEEALAMYFDIDGPIHKEILGDLLPYVKDPAQHQWLTTLIKPENDKMYQETVKSGNCSLTALLQTNLTSLSIPFTDFLHKIPHLKPRYYTISSSNLAHPNAIHLTIGLLVQQTLSTDGSPPRMIKGLCTSYLSSLTNFGLDRVRVFVTPSTFKLPSNPSHPIIMIGPGTGLAPMRALLQDRAAQRAANPDKKIGANVLYFGCRRSDLDYIYRDEMNAFVSSGVLTSLHVALSREGPKKVYVQDLLLNDDNATALVQYIDEGGHIYVCGGNKMGHDIQTAIGNIISSKKGLSKIEAMSFVSKLFTNGRLVQELWSSA